MTTIRKINVSQLDGRSPFDGEGPSSILPNGTLVLYENTNVSPSKVVLKMHDGITAGGNLVPVFESDGNLTVPNYIDFKDGSYIGDEGGAEPPIFRIVATSGQGIQLIADSGEGNSNHTWLFGDDGSVTFPDATLQTTAWAGGRVVSAPGTSTGAVGDLAGDLAFNGSYIYYCIQNYPTIHEATLIGGYSGNAFPSLIKGTYPQPLTGWTFVWNTVTYTLVENAIELNEGQWALHVDQTINTLGGGTITLTPPSGDIWKRVAWSNDTW